MPIFAIYDVPLFAMTRIFFKCAGFVFVLKL